jgi:hypothetical protein
MRDRPVKRPVGEGVDSLIIERPLGLPLCHFEAKREIWFFIVGMIPWPV